MRFLRRSRRWPVDQASRASHPDEIDVVHRVAVEESSTLRQLVGTIHVLSAVLYRLLEADAQLAQRLQLRPRDVRRWAVEHLPVAGPPRAPLPEQYRGSLDYDYAIELVPDGRYAYHQLRVTRKGVPTAPKPETMEPPADAPSKWVRFVRTRREPNPLLAARATLYRQLRDISRELGDAASPGSTLRKLLGILARRDPDVQRCLSDLGLPPESLIALLEEAP